MKKILYYAAALLTTAFAASCQQEKLDAPAAKDGDLVEVTFEISAEDALQTKAVVGETPDWDKELTFGAYRNGNLLPDDVYKIVNDFGTGTTATVTVTLVKGQEYDFVFWADAAGANYYSVDLQNKNVTVNYDGKNANDKYRDAWYTVLQGYKVTDQSFKETITLRRPLAQINVGTLDYQEAVNAGVTITKSNVTVSKVASTLDFFTGKTSNPVDVTFAVHTTPMLSLPQGDNTLTVYYGTEKEKEYDYLSLNYILVADDSATGFDKGLVDFKVDFYEEGNSNPVNDPIEIPNVPVRRNYRTNIVGDAVLTQEFDFEIIIDPLFYGEYVFDFATEQEIDYVLYKEDNNTWSIDTPEQLDFIAEMVNSGKYNFAGKTINLAKDIDLANDEFAPIGASGEFKGTFDGKGYTVKGLNVAMDDKDNSPAGLFGYVSGTLKNITVEGASVVGNTYVGGLVGHLTDGTVDNCTVKDSKVVNKAEKLDGTETLVTVATGGVVGYATTKAVIKAENKNTTVTANDNSDVIVGYQGEK